jgi:polysaccharide export outer membrane protein
LKLRRRYWLFLGMLMIGLLWIFPCVLQAQSQRDYLLGPEDVIEIIVWGHDDLRRILPISLEGTITFPFIGEVRATGKSTQDLEKEMAAKLGDGYLVKPQITISVKEYNSQKVFVMGEVNRPGTYPVTKENNLVYLLSQAGGPTKDVGEEVLIIRPNNPRSKGMTLEEAEAEKVPIITVNLREALIGDPKHNVSIRSGDSIIVSKIPFFFVMGEVKNPGKYNLERGTTVLMGISMAGGLTAKAAPGRTKIVREKDSKKIEMKVNMEIQVQPGDTIIVPESFF